MQTLTEVIAIGGLFFLRLGVPAMVIVLLTWWLRRLDTRWQQEAERARLANLDATLAVVADAEVDDRPCWEQRDCSPTRRAECPAYTRPSLACWCAREEVDGLLPSACVACGIYHLAHPATSPAAAVQISH